MPPRSSAPLAPCCKVCGKPDELSRYGACKAIQYCGKEHQAEDRNSHKTLCNAVKRARIACDKEEDELRKQPGDMFFAANPFETCVGRFWGIHETRGYMRARYAVVQAVLKINTYEAVQVAYNHLHDMLRLCRGDNMGVRYHVPSLLMRLGRGQDAYDFLKWWLTDAQRDDYDWGDMNLPYINITGADIFEPCDFICKKYTSLSLQADVTLLKIKVLLDLKDLQDSKHDFVPRSDIISKNEAIMNSKDHKGLIGKLEKQIAVLFEAVKQTNQYFWQGLLAPEKHLRAPQSAYSMGSIQEMQLFLQHSFNAWNETPGAIGMIRGKMNG